MFGLDAPLSALCREVEIESMELDLGLAGDGLTRRGAPAVGAKGDRMEIYQHLCFCNKSSVELLCELVFRSATVVSLGRPWR